MGYLDNTSVTVDAILTKKGRELLAAGSVDFQITQFAVGDDEVDYTLWNPNHPNGTDYYGTVIQNMPLLEAFPDETQVLRYKLITLPKNTTKIPAISVTNTSYTYTYVLSTPDIITPSTINITNGNLTLGYTAILSDSTWFDLQVGAAVSNAPQAPSFIGDVQSNQTVTKSGLSFTIKPKQIPNIGQGFGDQTATLTIIGNETGGQITINLKVKAGYTVTGPPVLPTF